MLVDGQTWPMSQNNILTITAKWPQKTSSFWQPKSIQQTQGKQDSPFRTKLAGPAWYTVGYHRPMGC